MKLAQLCWLLLAASVMAGTPLPAGPRELQDPESKDLSGHLFLQEMLGLGCSPQAAPHRSFRSTASRQPPPPPRARKAGCKSFYWKTLTAC